MINRFVISSAIAVFGITYVFGRSTVLPSLPELSTVIPTDVPTTIDIFAPTTPFIAPADIVSTSSPSDLLKEIIKQQNQTKDTVKTTTDFFGQPAASKVVITNPDTPPVDQTLSSDTSNIPEMLNSEITTIDIFAPTTPNIVQTDTSSSNKAIQSEVKDAIGRDTKIGTHVTSKTADSFTANTNLSVSKSDIITAQTAKNEKCPKFPAKYVEDALVLDIFSPGGCQMIVTVMDITPLFNLFSGSPFWDFLSQRRVKIPSVAFRKIQNNARSDITCPNFPVEVTGSHVTVTTVPGVCKMVLSVRTFPVGPTSPRESFSGSFMKQYRTRPVFESGNDGRS